MAQRTEHGTPLQTADQRLAAVPADIMGKLSKLPRCDVLRVLAAIAVIQQATGASAEDIVRWSGVPLALPDEKRSAATNALYDWIVPIMEDTEEGRALKLSERSDAYKNGNR